jgi:hypothetical protein
MKIIHASILSNLMVCANEIFCDQVKKTTRLNIQRYERRECGDLTMMNSKYMRVHPPAPCPGGEAGGRYQILSFFLLPLAISNEPKLSKKLP